MDEGGYTTFCGTMVAGTESGTQTSPKISIAPIASIVCCLRLRMYISYFIRYLVRALVLRTHLELGLALKATIDRLAGMMDDYHD
jgi:hypothetical protein